MKKYKKQEIYDLLKKNQISYQVEEHPAVYTMEDFQKINFQKKGILCKNLFLRNAKGDIHYLVVIGENKSISLKTLEKTIGSTRLSFASKERLEKYLHIEPGSVSPFNILESEEKSVHLIFDKALENQTIGVHPNENTATIWINASDVEKVLKQQGSKIEWIEI